MAKLTQSYASGTSQAPLIGVTIGAYFDAIAARFAERDAVIARHQSIRWSYGELNARVDALAAGLLALGLEPGDRVGIWAPNCGEWVVTQFATAKAGLIQVNINPAYRVSEAEYALNKVRCKALIVVEQFKSSNYIAMLRELAPEIGRDGAGNLISERLPHLRTLICIGRRPHGFLSFEDVMGLADETARAKLAAISPLLQFDDPINIQFTSGTTGTPKGATLTHHNLLNNGDLAAAAMEFTEADRLCIPVPMYHCFAMVLGVIACVARGAAMVFASDAFDAKATLEAIQAERCTAVHGVPTMFVAMLAQPEFKTYDLTSLRTGIMAGAPCPIELMRRVISEMGMREVTIGYGMTETSPIITFTSIHDSVERRVSSIGVAFPHTEVKIVDVDNRIVPVGSRGELCTRGYLVMRGYWEDPQKTAEAIDAAGWMHTGDLATMDADGYCNIVGRIKDLVIRGGENIYPREVEEFLYRHPKVEAVQVFGIPDQFYGEELCAWVKLKAGHHASAEDITGFCKGEIAHCKIPRHIRFVNEFPMTVTGKVQKFVMRERMIEELKLTVQRTA